MPAWITSLLRELAPVPKRLGGLENAAPRGPAARVAARPRGRRRRPRSPLRPRCPSVGSVAALTWRDRHAAVQWRASMPGEPRALSPRGRGRRADDRQSAGQCAVAGRARGPAAGAATRRAGGGRAGASSSPAPTACSPPVRTSTRWPPGRCSQRPSRATCRRDGGAAQADRGRHRRRRARRRLRAGAHLPLAARRAQRRSRAAGGEARTDPRRRRHATLHAPGGSRGGPRGDHQRRADSRRTRARARADRRARRRPAGGGDRLRAPGRRASAAAAPRERAG